MLVFAVATEIPTYVGQNLWGHMIESRFDHDELNARRMKEKDKKREDLVG
jgi:hypothetical protein